MDAAKGEEDLFFPELAMEELAFEKLRENLRIQFVVSRWEARLLRWVIGSFQALNRSSRKNGLARYVGLLGGGLMWFLLSTWVTIFHSRAHHVQSFYMSYYSKILGLEDAPYSKNKGCKVVTIYGDPAKC